MTAAGATANDACERHPATGPPTMPGNTFCAILTAGGCVLASRAKAIKDLTRAMFVNPQKRVGDAAAD